MDPISEHFHSQRIKKPLNGKLRGTINGIFRRGLATSKATHRHQRSFSFLNVGKGRFGDMDCTHVIDLHYPTNGGCGGFGKGRPKGDSRGGNKDIQTPCYSDQLFDFVLNGAFVGDIGNKDNALSSHLGGNHFQFLPAARHKADGRPLLGQRQGRGFTYARRCTGYEHHFSRKTPHD